MIVGMLNLKWLPSFPILISMPSSLRCLPQRPRVWWSVVMPNSLASWRRSSTLVALSLALASSGGRLGTRSMALGLSCRKASDAESSPAALPV